MSREPDLSDMPEPPDEWWLKAQRTRMQPQPAEWRDEPDPVQARIRILRDIADDLVLADKRRQSGTAAALIVLITIIMLALGWSIAEFVQ